MNEALRAYFPVADMIAATFGPCCEAAIHDFSQPETSVVHVAGQVTGRKGRGVVCTISSKTCC